MFHEAPTNEEKSGKHDLLQQHIPAAWKPEDLLCKALLGHCTLPVHQSCPPTGVTGQAKKSLWLGADVTCPDWPKKATETG